MRKVKPQKVFPSSLWSSVQAVQGSCAQVTLGYHRHISWLWNRSSRLHQKPCFHCGGGNAVGDYGSFSVSYLTVIRQLIIVPWWASLSSLKKQGHLKNERNYESDTRVSCQESKEATQKTLQSVVNSNNNNYEDYDDNGNREKVHTSSWKTSLSSTCQIAIDKGFLLVGSWSHVYKI